MPLSKIISCCFSTLLVFSEVLDMWPVEVKHDQICAQHSWCTMRYKRILNAEFNAEPLLSS